MLLEGRVIGLVEDDTVMGESLVQGLSLEGSRVEWWKSASEAKSGLRNSRPDLVICDMRLPDGRGDQLFYELALNQSLPPFFFITAYGDIDQAVAVMRAGAGDYTTKPFELSPFIERAKELIQRGATNQLMDVLLGPSLIMRNIESTLRRISDQRTPLLITGETGVGKEVCARFLHSVSSRSAEPFVAVNCAAIPHDVMERELFGSRNAPGQSFHHGFAERTRGGILFLDEISELAMPLQAKLLRLVEGREFHRVGGEQRIEFRGRIVCATHQDLGALVAIGKFRSDLFYRINPVVVNVPPLRDRPDDVPWLVEQFLHHASNHSEKFPRGVSSLAWEELLAHDWPGNVRELRNRIERAASLTQTEWLMPSDLFPDRSHVAGHPMIKSLATLAEARDSAERRQIMRALHETKGQILEAAALLGISRTTLWDKMRRLNVQAHEK
jgi:DNA-binding NtrC family response regulator